MRVIGRWKLGGEKITPGAAGCIVRMVSSEYECWWWLLAADADAAGSVGGGDLSTVSVYADPMPLYGDAGVRGDWPRLSLRMKPLESRLCRCGDEEVGVSLLDV